MEKGNFVKSYKYKDILFRIQLSKVANARNPSIYRFLITSEVGYNSQTMPFTEVEAERFLEAAMSMARSFVDNNFRHESPIHSTLTSLGFSWE